MDDLLNEYRKLLSVQIFDEGKPDYTLMETWHKPILTQLAKVSNSMVSVFDMYTQTHVFASHNFFDLFGHHTDINQMDKKIHPEDTKCLMRHAVFAIKYVYSHKENIKNYKFITEYRIRNASGEYIRVIEQQSVLETDQAGNAWLALSVIDLSPDRNTFKPVTSALFNIADNTLFSIQDLYNTDKTALSPREIEILQLIKGGKLSKEISERLGISVHTVNTHRQKILEKLNAGNSMEAVQYASALGLLN